MKVCRVVDLPASDKSHIFGGVVPGKFIYEGGMVFEAPGNLAHHDEERHTHPDGEVFLLLQGQAVVHLDGANQPLSAGDVAVIEPDENHHLESDERNPCVVIWLHCGPEKHPRQT